MKFVVVLIGVIGLVYWFIFRPNPADYKSQITLKDPIEEVQDSMKVLRKLCESINGKVFLTCHVRPDSVLAFNVDTTKTSNTPIYLGRIDTVSVANQGFINTEKSKAARLLVVLKFLNRNLIGGIVHDTSTGHWWYPYGSDNYNNNYWVRHLTLLESPEDTLKPAFNFFFKIIDRKGQIVLTGNKDIF